MDSVGEREDGSDDSEAVLTAVGNLEFAAGQNGGREPRWSDHQSDIQVAQTQTQGRAFSGTSNGSRMNTAVPSWRRWSDSTPISRYVFPVSIGPAVTKSPSPSICSKVPCLGSCGAIDPAQDALAELVEGLVVRNLGLAHLSDDRAAAANQDLGSGKMYQGIFVARPSYTTQWIRTKFCRRIVGSRRSRRWAPNMPLGAVPVTTHRPGGR